jgi:tripartite-type tricarboxylate transporter receptor subunit TctC
MPRLTRSPPRFALALLCAALLAIPLAAAAQEKYPEKPIRFIVAWPPGGGTDGVARVVANLLSQRIKHPVVVENKSGASGQVGTEYVARSAPDGYTLQYTVADSHSINPHVFKGVRYDALKDFTPVAVVGGMPNALAVHPNVPAKTVSEFVKIARENPGKYTYASWGIGSGGHIRMESFDAFTKVELLHVPFQGSGPGFAAVLGGQVDAMMVPLGMAVEHHKAGKVRILAVDTPQRAPEVSEVPTFQEQDVPLSFSFWQGVLAPAKTPDHIVEFLNREINAALAEPQAKEQLARVGLVLGKPGVNGFAGSPVEVRKFMEVEYDRWGKVIRDAKISVE